MSDALESATSSYLAENRSPSRKVHELDNRGSTFYLALYWARALAAQTVDPGLAERFRPVAEALEESTERILEELDAAQGTVQELGGYYATDPDMAARAMRPSATFNAIISAV